MFAQGEIFLELILPNATTWFYFSVLLAVALFVKFSRVLSMRNWDVFTLFLLMPGYLLLVESDGKNRWGYVWLLGASGYFVVRCLIDLVLERRPTLTPNLSLGGMVWLALALFISLIAVACRPPMSRVVAGTAPSLPDEVLKQPVETFVRGQTDRRVDDERVGLGVERGLALACHLAIIVGMVIVGWRVFEDLLGGVAAATFYLLLPYNFLLVPLGGTSFARWDHAWPMALLVWSLVWYRRPMVAGTFLGLATGTAFFPVYLVPLWFSFYEGRGAWRFLFVVLGVASLCIGVICLLTILNGIPWPLAHCQPWQARAGTPSAWEGTHWAYSLPVYILFLAVVLLTLVWPAPKNLAHVLALSCVVLLGIQFWDSDRGGVYVLWYLPYLLLMVFRPNLSACRPPNIPDFWLLRILRWFRRLFRPRKPVTPPPEVALPPATDRR